MSSLGNKQVLAYNLNNLMKSRGIDRNDLCEALNLKYSTVSEWLSANKYPRIDKIELLANYFKVQKSALIEENVEHQTLYAQFDNISPIQTQRLPLLGEIACGEPIWCDVDRESYVEVGTNIRADFCLRAKGDSMINARICDGDIVFIRQQPIVENGDIAAVIIDNEATLKRVYLDRENGKLVLQAENPKYSPLVYVGDELNNIRILGKAIAFESNL